MKSQVRMAKPHSTTGVIGDIKVRTLLRHHSAHQIQVIGLVVTSLALFSCSRSETPTYAGLTFSPDGKYLLCSYAYARSSFIYKVALDTGRATRLTSAIKGFEGVPSMSPDGKLIAYSYSPGKEPFRIVIANVDGSSAYTLKTPDPNDFRPLFGTRNTIIFARPGYYGSYSPIAQPKQHEWNLYVSDLFGRNLRQLTNDNFYMLSRVSLSHDGKTLLFAAGQGDEDYLATYSLEQPATPLRTFKPNIERSKNVFSDPVFLPDDQNILFLAASAGTGDKYDYDIYRMNLGTEKVEQITRSNGYTYGLQVSRDARKAVFVREVSEVFNKRSDLVLFDLLTRKQVTCKATGLDH